jgi:hypothetical protein
MRLERKLKLTGHKKPSEDPDKSLSDSLTKDKKRKKEAVNS